MSDLVSLAGESEGDGTGYHYTVTFGSSVENPVIHLYSFASTFTFDSGVTLSKLSGDENFIVSGNQVTGTTIDGVVPNDSLGTIRLEGSFTTFSFNAVWNTCNLASSTSSGTCPSGNVDGIGLQLGAESVVVPIPPAIVLLASGLFCLSSRTSRRSRSGPRTT